MQSQRIDGRVLSFTPICLILLASCLWPEMELLVPSLPTMKAVFQVNDGEIQQLLTANFLGFLCGVLLTGGLCDSWGRKKTIVWGLVLYLFASLAAVFVDSFSWLMLLRFIQGLAVTAPIVAGTAMLMDVTAGPSQITWMAISSATVTICMAGAPLLGAWINVNFGYKGNLLAIFIMGLIGGAPVLLLSETLAPEKRKRFNLQSLMHGYGQVIRHQTFMMMVLPICVFAAAYWVYTGVSALYMVDYLKMDPALFGTYQGPIVGAFSVCSLGMSIFHTKWGARRSLWIGFFSMLIANIGLVMFALLGIESALFTTIAMMLYVAGMVPSNSILFPIAINQLPADQQGSGQSIVQGLRLVFASLGTGLLGLIYTGPFTPVAFLLLTAFCIGTYFIWKTRHRFAPELARQQHIMPSGH